METQMEQLLKKFNTLEPNRGFKERSRSFILNSPQKGDLRAGAFRQFFNIAQFSAAFGLVAIFIFLILGGLSFINKKLISPSLLSGLDSQNLEKEVKNLDIQIQLSQAQYYEDSAEAVEVALKAASGELDKAENRNQEINKLLDGLTL